jgi:hypothetical protein
MARYSYMIPRDTKGEGKILMIFSRKSFIGTAVCAGIGLITIYPIFLIAGLQIAGIIGVLIFGLIGFIVTTLKMPNSSNFELLRKTGGENIDEILKRYVMFKRKGKKIYLYNTGGKEDE